MRALLTLALLLLVTPVHAQDARVRTRRVGAHWRDGVPHVDFSARDLADERLRERLSSGLPETLLMRVYAYRPGANAPLAVAPLSCTVTFDIWEEVYSVLVQDAGTDRTETYDDLDGVLSRCLRAQRMPVGRAGDYPAGADNVYFAVLVELNPLTPDTVHRMRRWLARPASGGRVGGDAFFGSFVSLFVNRQIGSAERTLRFRSQDIAVQR
jgi:hypothetical protein